MGIFSEPKKATKVETMLDKDGFITSSPVDTEPSKVLTPPNEIKNETKPTQNNTVLNAETFDDPKLNQDAALYAAASRFRAALNGAKQTKTEWLEVPLDMLKAATNYEDYGTVGYINYEGVKICHPGTAQAIADKNNLDLDIRLHGIEGSPATRVTA